MNHVTQSPRTSRADAVNRANVAASTPSASGALAADELVYLPLNRLEFDADNVRKRGGENVEALKALILAQDLLQNLVVCPLVTPRGKPTGKYGVIAGGRRLRALRALAEEGHVAADKDVLCLIKPRAQAILASTAENSGREAMSGPDTIVAFAAMVRAGTGVEELALAFGLSEVTVRRRLKLANVSPRLFALYAQEQVTLDQLMGLAVIDDHARQEALWDGASEYQRSGAQLRRAALGTAVSAASDRLARFVGVDAYMGAGGQMIKDLFADDDAGYIADPALLARLASERLGVERERLLVAGHAWVEVVDDFDYTARQHYVEAPTSMREPTKGEKKAIDAARLKLVAADQALRAYQDADGEGDDDRYEALEEAADAAAGHLEALLGELKSVSPEVQALCGAVLTVESSGQLRIHRHLVRKQDAKRAAAVARQADAGTRGDGAACEADGACGLSEALLGRLAAQRSMALQVEVARQPQVALVVLVAALLPELGLGRDGYAYSSISARSRQGDLRQADASIESSPAWGEMATLVAAVGAALPADGAAVLPWLLAQPVEGLVPLLALCAARSIYCGAGSLRKAQADLVADAVGLDMTRYWQASGETYFKAVPKALIAEAIADVDADQAQTVGTLTKGAAVALAEVTLKNAQWLPVALRRVPAPGPRAA